MRHLLSERTSKCLRGPEYTCRWQVLHFGHPPLNPMHWNIHPQLHSLGQRFSEERPCRSHLNALSPIVGLCAFLAPTFLDSLSSSPKEATPCDMHTMVGFSLEGMECVMLFNSGACFPPRKWCNGRKLSSTVTNYLIVHGLICYFMDRLRVWYLLHMAFLGPRYILSFYSMKVLSFLHYPQTKILTLSLRCSANDRSGFHTHLSIQLFASLFLGHGILGCNATQMHEKIVARLLQIMFYMVRQCMRSVQGFVPNERLLMGGVGLPSLEAPWAK